MSEAKHTPGPWKIESLGPPSVWVKTRAGDMKIADVRGWGHLTGIGGLNLPGLEAEAIQDANARLIAAAPDLLSACKVVTAFLAGLEDSANSDLDKALANVRKQVHAPLRAALHLAIAKAEGVSKAEVYV